MRNQAVVVSLLMLSCAPDRPPVNPHTTIGQAPPPATIRNVPFFPGEQVEAQASASMRGTLGSVRDFQATGLEVRTRHIPQGTLVEMHAEDPAANWWVMVQFGLAVPLTDPAWAPGSHMFSNRGNTLGLNVLGCSGPVRNRFTFDANAATLELLVSRGSTPASRYVHFTARWTNRDDVIHGFVELFPE